MFRWSSYRQLAVCSLAAMILVPATLTLGPETALAGPETALEDYVNAPDQAYGFTLVAYASQGGVTIYLLYMTSQQWRTPEEVDRTLWWHWLGIIVPQTVLTDTGMLIIAGGSNNPSPPSFNDEEVVIGAQISLASRSVVAIIAQVPNQPLYFADEPYSHKEDELVAYSWDKAMDTGDYFWPAYLPMVKSAVRAMDTVQTFVPQVSPAVVNRFVVVGFSKRGATTWLTAAVDPRVRAISPGVIDMLNLAPHIEHHYKAYGSYSPAIHDYVDYDIVRRVRIPEGQALLQVVDPYSYLEQLTIPKFLINSTGDQFFLPDSAQFYLPDLQGETLIRYVPNTDHSLSNSKDGLANTLYSLLAWYQRMLVGVPPPKITWTNENGSLTVAALPPARRALLWQATNPSARDFRREIIGESWVPSYLADQGGGVYQANVQPPPAGWRAYFVELIYQGVAGVPQTYSTQIFVTPEALPFALDEPLGDPKGKGFWKHQIRVAETGRGSAQVDPETLAGYFPFPVFGNYFTSIAGAGMTLWGDQADMTEHALQHCLALRLNLANGSLGWYTPIDLDGQERYLWEHWNGAYQAFLAGEPELAKGICEAINNQ